MVRKGRVEKRRWRRIGVQLRSGASALCQLASTVAAWGHFVLGSKHSFRRRGGAVEPRGRGRGKGRPPIDGSIDRVVDGWIGAVVRVC